MSVPSVPLSPVDRIPAVVTLTATNPEGTPATITTVAVAALPRGDLPDATTTWTAATFAGGSAPITLAGPSATAQAGDVVVTGSAHLWAKDSGADYTQAVIVGFVYID